MLTASSRIWTLIITSISNNQNHYTSYNIYIYIYMLVLAQDNRYWSPCEVQAWAHHPFVMISEINLFASILWERTSHIGYDKEHHNKKSKS